MKKTLTLLIFFVIYFNLTDNTFAAIINIPADFSTIQAGIDASSDGDTILVQQGTYVENIILNSKNIVLASNYLFSEDTLDIHTTIIDGDSVSSVVTFESCDSLTAIIGFTIRNGSGSVGGIKSNHSNPLINHNIIRDNYGITTGGIYCAFSNPKIFNNIIIENITTGYTGYLANGGISCYQSNPMIYNNIIAKNIGIGIRCQQSDPSILNCIITENTAVGIYIDSNPTITNTIIWNNNISSGIDIDVYGNGSPVFTYCDISGGWEGEGNVDLNPLFVKAYNNNFNLCSQSPLIDIGDPAITDPDGTRSDIGVFFPEHPECSFGNISYVSLDGNDNSGDGTLENPFRTIQHSIDVSSPYDTIIVENGTYVENIILNNRIIVLASEYIFSGDTLDINNTVIDGDSITTVVYFIHCDSLATLTGFTIRNGFDTLLYNNKLGGGVLCRYSNPRIISDIITKNTSRYGGGIFCLDYSNPSIIKTTIRDNYAVKNGGGIYCDYYSSPLIIDSDLSENKADSSGGGFYCEGGGLTIVNTLITKNSSYSSCNYCSHSNLTIINCTISSNSSYGTGGLFSLFSNINIKNSIFWNNIGGAGSGNLVLQYSTTDISYSNIQGGWDGEGNIDINPLFIDIPTNNYNVCSQSQCINTGDPDLIDPDGTRSDIGVYYFEHPECISGNIWYVATSGSDLAGDGSINNPFETIQHSINNAFPGTGDTIVVQNGTYVENVNFYGKNIVLASNYIISNDTLDVQNTIIDGDSITSVITLIGCDSTSEIIGITIRNGGRGVYGNGGGIFCFSDTRISNNRIEYNTCDNRGGGVCLMNSTSTLLNNKICNNTGTINGGGIYGNYYSNPNIMNNIISENIVQIYYNQPNDGGGINCSNATISNNTISNNLSFRRGGGIYCSGADNLIITDNVINGNEASQSGGGIYSSNSNLYIANNIISNNSASNESYSATSGGGISCWYISSGHNITITNNLISNNLAYSPSATNGGGLYLSGYCNYTITNNTIIDNISRLYGGGVAMHASQVTFSNNIISGDSALYGGALYLINYGYNIQNSIITSNKGYINTYCHSAYASLSCSDVYDNQGGDWVGCFSGQSNINGNFSADPLFCDTANGDFHISNASLCAPENNSCGTLVGAHDIGCWQLTVLTPNPIYLLSANTIDTTDAQILTEQIPYGYSPSDVNLSTLIINSSIIPTTSAILPIHPMFSGELLEIYFPLRDFILGYGFQYDTTIQPYTVSGEFTDGTPFTIENSFTFISHISGDINFDGVVDISDLVFFVDYFFFNGPIPQPIEAGDVNRDGQVDIGDLVVLVERMFL